MRALVTGANGFLGSAIVRHLLEAGYEVRAMVRNDNAPPALKGLDIEIRIGDILDIQTLDRIVKGCPIILHLASSYTFYPWWQRNPRGIYATNVEGTRNLLSAALHHKVERFIFTSSVAAIGREANGKPSSEETIFTSWSSASHYARSKILAEYEVLKFCSRGLPSVILNPAIIIGERDYKPTPSGEMIVKFLNRSYPGYFDGTWPMVDVEDVARAHVQAIKKGRPGERYILALDRAYTLEEIFGLLEEVSGVKSPTLKIPYWLLSVFVYIEEAFSSLVLERKPLISSEGMKFCRMSLVLDTTKATKELGFSTLSIKETLAKAVSWYKQNGYVKTR